MELEQLIQELQEIKKKNGNCLVGIAATIKFEEFQDGEEFRAVQRPILPLNRIHIDQVVVLIPGGEWPKELNPKEWES